MAKLDYITVRNYNYNHEMDFHNVGNGLDGGDSFYLVLQP